jgi:hypothetical protein
MLKFICADLDARPLFWTEDNKRFGFEPEVAQAIAGEVGEELQWVFLKWADFFNVFIEWKGRCHNVWFGNNTGKRKTISLLQTLCLF